MKKQLFLASALALVTLASCGGNSGGIKVGLICLHDKNSTYDANFIQAFESACEKAKKEGKISGYSYVTDVAEDDACYTAAERFVHQGYSIVFSDSFGHDEYMAKIAKDHKNVFFSSATGVAAQPTNIPNFHNAFASIYEGRFLAGMAAGEYIKEHQDTMVKKNKVVVGYVGAFPYAEVISGYTSWYLGVKYALTHGATTVTAPLEMKVTYTKSWYDYDKEAAAADNLINNHECVLISQHADSMGAPNTCKTLGVPNVSYNINTAETDPTCKSTYIAHSRINWEPYYTAVLNTAVGSPIEGEEKYNWTGTLDTNSVEYNVSDLISANGKNEIETAKDELKKGVLQVFDTKSFTVNDLESKASYYTDEEQTAPVKDTDYTIDTDGHLLTMKGDIDGDFSRETDLITKGDSWVKESYFRSAPAFDFIIDGITKI